MPTHESRPKWCLVGHLSSGVCSAPKARRHRACRTRPTGTRLEVPALLLALMTLASACATPDIQEEPGVSEKEFLTLSGTLVWVGVAWVLGAVYVVYITQPQRGVFERRDVTLSPQSPLVSLQALLLWSGSGVPLLELPSKADADKAAAAALEQLERSWRAAPGLPAVPDDDTCHVASLRDNRTLHAGEGYYSVVYVKSAEAGLEGDMERLARKGCRELASNSINPLFLTTGPCELALVDFHSERRYLDPTRPCLPGLTLYWAGSFYPPVRSHTGVIADASRYMEQPFPRAEMTIRR